jgi:alcohol dehydrogenase (cytochrome c)
MTRTIGIPRRCRCSSTARSTASPAKLLAMAARNGYYFLLDRATGKNIVTDAFIKAELGQGYRGPRVPIARRAKHPQVDGALVTPNQGGATNWPPPTFSPQTGLFYVAASVLQCVLHLRRSRRPARMGRRPRGRHLGFLHEKRSTTRPASAKWTHKWETPAGRPGLMRPPAIWSSPAMVEQLRRAECATGDPLWHAISRRRSPTARSP